MLRKMKLEKYSVDSRGNVFYDGVLLNQMFATGQKLDEMSIEGDDDTLLTKDTTEKYVKQMIALIPPISQIGTIG